MRFIGSDAARATGTGAVPLRSDELGEGEATAANPPLYRGGWTSSAEAVAAAAAAAAAADDDDCTLSSISSLFCFFLSFDEPTTAFFTALPNFLKTPRTDEVDDDEDDDGEEDERERAFDLAPGAP